MNGPVLTVIVPLYNEAATVRPLLERVLSSPIEKQIVVIDDGSTDETLRIIERMRLEHTSSRIDLLRHRKNRGKGAAIRTGLAAAQGEVILIQDGDLKYDPADYPRILEPILSGAADLIYGSRYRNPANPLPWTKYRLCVHMLNGLVRWLYGRRMTDEATCYKAFRADVIRRCDLRCERFEFCPEITAKICRMGIPIQEVPIRYQPRSRAEGKKIRFRDGLEAMATLVYWRFARFRPLEPEAHRPRFADGLVGSGAER